RTCTPRPIGGKPMGPALTGPVGSTASRPVVEPLGAATKRQPDELVDVGLLPLAGGAETCRSCSWQPSSRGRAKSVCSPIPRTAQHARTDWPNALQAATVSRRLVDRPCGERGQECREGSGVGPHSPQRLGRDLPKRPENAGGVYDAVSRPSRGIPRKLSRR